MFFLDLLLKWWDHVLVIASSNTQTRALKKSFIFDTKMRESTKDVFKEFFSGTSTIHSKSFLLSQLRFDQYQVAVWRFEGAKCVTD